jgi:hypothetical protein
MNAHENNRDNGVSRMSSLPAQGSPYWQSSTSSEGPEGLTTPQAVPTYKLFDSTSVGIATLLGSALAGATLMAINYRRLGKATEAVIAMIIAAAAMAIVIGVGSWYQRLPRVQLPSCSLCSRGALQIRYKAPRSSATLTKAANWLQGGRLPESAWFGWL